MADGVPKTADRDLGTAPTVDSGAPQSAPPPPGDDPLLGRMLHHFRVDAPLGAGGMGAVYRGWDTALDRPVALKVLASARPDARARFLREARTQAKLRHPNVVPIHFVGEVDGVAFLSMDIVEGESLSDRLRRERRLSPEVALRIARDVAAALAAGATVGLVHRDVKPSNILLEPSGRVMLADFGLAKVVSSQESGAATDAAPVTTSGVADTTDAQLTHRGAILGTPAYMAPEQTRGEPCDHRADIYSLGVTLYEAMAGDLPFTAPTTEEILEQQRSSDPLPPRTLVPELAPSTEALVLRAMRKLPGDRFQTYDELARAIDAELSPPSQPAGLIIRGGAFLVDVLVFAIPAALVSSLVLEGLGGLVLAIAFGLVEGRWGRTAGKYLLSLRTVGPHDARPGYARSFARAALKMWGPMLAPLTGALPAGAWQQAVSAIVIIPWALGLLVAAGRDKTALHDRAFRTRVVYALRP